MSFYRLSLTCQIKNFDELLEKYIGKKEHGVFVEIGAMNGETWSFTSGLADMGWEGHYVEPQKDQCIECSMRHQLNNCTVDALAIGRENGTLTLHKAYGNACATTSDTDMLSMLVDNSMLSEFQSPMMTLDDYLQGVMLNTDKATSLFWPNFELLVVDTEGTEHDVLHSFDVEYWRPKMIVVEMHQGNSLYQHLESVQRKQREVHEKLDPLYDVVYEDTVNTVFVLKAIAT